MAGMSKRGRGEMGQSQSSLRRDARLRNIRIARGIALLIIVIVIGAGIVGLLVPSSLR